MVDSRAAVTLLILMLLIITLLIITLLIIMLRALNPLGRIYAYDEGARGRECPIAPSLEYDQPCISVRKRGDIYRRGGADGTEQHPR